jgi:hypothetical protein
VLASDVARILGSWGSCLVWATDWDVWVNEEDWPAYYRWRGEHRERRSLGAAPGHLFTRDDMADFLALVTHAIRCGWDVTILPVSTDGPTGTRVRCSHDEWIEARSTQPISFVAPAV